MKNIAWPIAEIKAANARNAERARLNSLACITPEEKAERMKAGEDVATLLTHEERQAAIAAIERESSEVLARYGLKPLTTEEKAEANKDAIKHAEYEAAHGYKGRRASEYPPIQAFLDAFYWERVGITGPMEAWINTVTGIKNKHPKP